MDIKYKSEVEIPVNKEHVKGELIIPAQARAVVLFAHGSGSGRFSPRNQKVAQYLLDHHIGTLLFDLLTIEEDADYNNRFNIQVLSDRLIKATKWLQNRAEVKNIPLAYFGASTGAAAALIAASALPQIAAVVSRGGRPDLAMKQLPKVQVPTLLIVGSRDVEVLQLNNKALDALTSEKKLAVVEGATHLFEEPGTLDQVCSLATDWFESHVQEVKKINNHKR